MFEIVRASPNLTARGLHDDEVTLRCLRGEDPLAEDAIRLCVAARERAPT